MRWPSLARGGAAPGSAAARLVRLGEIPFVRYAAYLAVWLAVFFAGAWPAWQAAYDHADRIESADARIASLTAMASAGAWFNAAAARWEPVQQEEYDRSFPRTKAREELFLAVARVARDADIDPITLREIPIPRDPADEQDDPEAESAGDEELTRLVEQFAADTGALPSTGLSTYRLAAGFDTDYARLARFLAGLRTIPRALTVHGLRAGPGPDAIRVTLELDFYVQAAPQR